MLKFSGYSHLISDTKQFTLFGVFKTRTQKTYTMIHAEVYNGKNALLYNIYRNKCSLNTDEFKLKFSFKNSMLTKFHNSH